MAETGPLPILRFRNQPSPDGVSMNIAQFLHELVVFRDVEIVIMRLPEGSFPASHRNRQFEGLDRPGQKRARRLVYQQMDMLRHDDVTGYHKQVAEANSLQGIFKEFHRRKGGQVRTTMITTERQEVELP